MRTVTRNELSIFLASSAELLEDREKFGDFVMHLQKHYSNRGISFQLEKWEYLDGTRPFLNRRKQDEYNDFVRSSDVFLCLFYTRAGKFTTEEFDVALEENERRQLPLFISMRNLDKNQQEDESLTQFKERLKGLEHFWHNYENNDKLHLDFVLWIDSYLFDGKSVLKTSTDGTVTLGDVKVAQMSQLPFAAKNEVYQRLNKEIKDLNAKIVKYRQRVEKYPDDPDFQDELQQKIESYVKLTKEFDGYQQTLLDTAKQIADIRKKHAGEMLQKAIEAFNSGDTRQANVILRGIATEAEKQRHIEDYEQKKQQSDKAQELTDNAQIVVHQDIDAFQLQAKSELADVDTPIEERITKVSKIYSKADDWAQRSDYDEENYVQLLSEFAQFLNRYSNFKGSLQIILRLVEKLEKLYGFEHVETATAYSRLGFVYLKLGETQKALEYLNKALPIRLKKLGKNHADTAITYYDLGLVYFKNMEGKKNNQRKKMDYDQALYYFNKARVILEKVYGIDHEETAKIYYSIGLVYKSMGQYNDYKYYLIKTLSIRQGKDISDKEGIEKAVHYETLGHYYKSNKEYDEAIYFFKMALKIREELLGKYHISIASSYERIGLIYESRKLLDEALDAFRNSLSIRVITLGENHSKTAVMYARIAVIYNRQKKNDEAIQFYIKALESYHNSSEVNSDKIANMYDELGKLYLKKENYSKAIDIYSKALGIYEKSPKENSGMIVEIQDKIGNIYRMQNDKTRAKEFYLKALDNQKKWLGEDHEKVIYLTKKIGDIYEEIGEIGNATRYYEELLDILVRVSGDQNPKVADSYFEIGLRYKRLGQDSQANDCFAKSKLIRMRIKSSDNKSKYPIIIYKRATIEEHLELIEELEKVQSNEEPSMELAQHYFEIAEIYYNQGDYGQAISNATESLSIYENYFSGEHPMISKICGLMGSAYKADKNYAKAAEYYQKSLDVFQEYLVMPNTSNTSQLRGIAHHYSRIGEMHFLLGDYQTALKYHTEALQIVEKIGVINGFIASHHYYIGKDYEGLGKYQIALNHYTMAFDYYNTKYGPNDPGTLRAKENIDRVEEKLRLGSSSE